MDGLILLNLGSPARPRTGPVRRYLRQFLADPRVIDINAVGRWLLLNLIILPLRPRRTAALYRKIWRKSEPGSPLLYYSIALARALEKRLAKTFRVVVAMRYGEPSLAGALRTLAEAGIIQVRLVPLYPQYSPASSGTGLAEAYVQAARLWNVPFLTCLPPFYDHPAYIRCLADLARRTIAASEAERGTRIDHVLFSFHGVPERQIKKSDPFGECLGSENCCDTPRALAVCYRAQCFATARALGGALGLQSNEWSVAFQSRLGRTPWVKPYTDEVLPRLVGRGVRNLAVLSPSFVADCLETLEEIAMQGRETFLTAGGEGFLYIPCLNDDPAWVAALGDMICESAPL